MVYAGLGFVALILGGVFYIAWAIWIGIKLRAQQADVAPQAVLVSR